MKFNGIPLNSSKTSMEFHENFDERRFLLIKDIDSD